MRFKPDWEEDTWFLVGMVVFFILCLCGMTLTKSNEISRDKAREVSREVALYEVFNDMSKQELHEYDAIRRQCIAMGNCSSTHPKSEDYLQKKLTKETKK